MEYLEYLTGLRMLSHPHLLSVIGVSSHDGRFATVMPYMAGGDLRSYLLKQDDQVDNNTYKTLRTKNLQKCLFPIEKCVSIGNRHF